MGGERDGGQAAEMSWPKPRAWVERSIWAADSAGGGVGGGGHSTVPSGGRGLCPLPSPCILPPLSVWKGEWQLATGVGLVSRPTEGSLLPERRSTIPKDAQQRENSREEWPGGPALSISGQLPETGRTLQSGWARALSCSESGDPQSVPLPSSQQGLVPWLCPRGAPWPSQRCPLALRFSAILSSLSATHLFVPISGRLSESLAGTRAHPGWAADQDYRQRPKSRAAFILCPLHLGESDPGALHLPFREHLLHVSGLGCKQWIHSASYSKKGIC